MPGFKTVIATLIGTVAVAATTVACSSPGRGTAPAGPPSAAQRPHDCPTAALPTTGTAGPPAGQAITMATSIAPSDTSTSTVLTNLSGPQIQCGRTALDTYSDVVFATPTGAGGTPLPLKLDIQVPKTAGPKPLVVYVTGGGFVTAPKENGLNLRTYVAEAGYAVASVQYRTVPDGATYADGVADVKSAIRYLRAHADQYRIDPDQVAVWGESAGGYLASMVGTTNSLPRFDIGADLDRSSAVQAVVDKFGPSDLTKLAADFDPAMQRYSYQPGNSLAHWAGVSAGRSILDDPAAASRADPITYVTHAAPPFLIMHGSADKLVSPSQTLLLHTALRAAGVDSTRFVLAGANHGDLAFLNDPAAALPWSTQEVMNHIVAFLNGHLTRR
jgi:acetyl esterase/lipase